MKLLIDLTDEQIEDRLVELIDFDDKGQSLPMLKMLRDFVKKADLLQLKGTDARRVASRLKKEILNGELE